VKLDMVRFAKSVYDPESPDSLGRSEFASAGGKYQLTLDGSVVIVQHGGRRYAYPVALIACAREACTVEVPRVRR
jgi:hypothetical protein